MLKINTNYLVLYMINQGLIVDLYLLLHDCYIEFLQTTFLTSIEVNPNLDKILYKLSLKTFSKLFFFSYDNE